MGRLAGVASVLAAPWPTGLLSLGGVAPAMALWLHGQLRRRREAETTRAASSTCVIPL